MNSTNFSDHTILSDIQSKESADINWLQRFIELVNSEMCNKDLDNEYLAKRLEISQSSLNRQLNRIAGTSPHKFIRKLRLNKAKKLLKSGNYRTVKEIAALVGFTKVQHFSHLFEYEFGIKPIEMLKD